VYEPCSSLSRPIPSPWKQKQTWSSGIIIFLSFDAKQNNKTTLVWFLREYLSYVTKTTEKQLLIPEFHTPSSPWCRDDVMLMEPRHYVDLSNNTHDVIEDPRWHWRNRGNPYYTYVVSDIFIPCPDTTTWSPDSTGQIFLVFYEIYRVGDSARCLINFARKGILVCVF
jgi:hypothetical protein